MSKLGVPPPFAQRTRRSNIWFRWVALTLGALGVANGAWLIYLAPSRWWGGALVIVTGGWLLWKYSRLKAAA